MQPIIRKAEYVTWVCHVITLGSILMGQDFICAIVTCSPPKKKVSTYGIFLLSKTWKQYLLTSSFWALWGLTNYCKVSSAGCRGKLIYFPFLLLKLQTVNSCANISNCFEDIVHEICRVLPWIQHGESRVGFLPTSLTLFPFNLADVWWGEKVRSHWHLSGNLVCYRGGWTTAIYIDRAY